MLLELKDKNAKSIVIFSDFVIKAKGKPILIECNIEINVSCFKVKSIINIELLDIKELKNNLMMLKSNTKWSFHFQHNDDRIHLIFKPDELGHIGISGVFKSVDYKDQLDFKFETDQTFILFMLKQCDEILKNT